MPDESDPTNSTTGEVSPASDGQMGEFAAIMAEAENDPQMPAVAEEAPATEETPAETPVEEDDQQLLPFNPQPAKLPTKRDLSGLAPDHAKLFKAMSNEAYDFLRPIFDEHQKGAKAQSELQAKLEEARGQRWYETENAYTLAPEYQHLTDNLSKIDFEERYWQEQLAAAEEGKPITMLTGIDKETGQYILGEPESPTAKHKAVLFSNLAKAQQIRSQLTDNINQLRSNYSGKFKRLDDELGKVDQTLFAKLDTNNPTVKAKFDKWVNQFPEEVRGQRVYQMLAKGMVAIESLVEKLKSQEAKTAVRKIVSNTVRSNGPGNGVTSAASIPTRSVDEDFERRTGMKLD